MRLPQELIDEIFNYIPLNDLQTFRNFSLVAKAWVHRSRKRLFHTVSISKSTYDSWVDNISPTNLELLHHVRSLTYTLGTTARVRFPGYRIDSLGDYLPSFRNLETLVLASTDLPSGVSQQIANFSAFRHTLSSLSLWSCYVSSGAVITLVNYFPNLIDLQLRAPMHRVDYKPSPPLLRPLRGRLCVQKFKIYDLPVLDRLSDLPPELDELIIGGTPTQTPVSYDHIIATYAGSAERLRLLHGFTLSISPTLSHCRKLRELELYVVLPARVAESLITSIASTKLRRIAFSAQGLAERLASSDVARSCDAIDSCLCQLVDRLRKSGYERTLEVEFRAWGRAEWELGLDFKRLLPKFQGKGRVRMVRMSPWRVSDGSGESLAENGGPRP